MYMTNINPKNPVFSINKHRVTYGFMAPEYGSPHRGCDLVPGAVGVDSDIIAVGEGVVEIVKNSVKATLALVPASNWTSPDVLGNFVRIRHNNRFGSRYCHLAFGSIKVKAGDYIKKGQVIATIGNTGLSTAPHLHFEIFDNNERIDPLPFLMGSAKFDTGGIDYNNTQNNIETLAKQVIRGEWGVGQDRIKRLTAAGHDAKAVQNRVNEILKGITITNPAEKSLDTIAKEVIRGDWGNNPERTKRLTDAGYDAKAVQKRVNEILG